MIRCHESLADMVNLEAAASLAMWRGGDNRPGNPRDFAVSLENEAIHAH